MVSFSLAGVQALLEVVNDLFEEQTDLEKIVRKIMHRAQTLLKCERCSVQLLEDIESPVFCYFLCCYMHICAVGERNKVHTYIHLLLFLQYIFKEKYHTFNHIYWTSTVYGSFISNKLFT